MTVRKPEVDRLVIERHALGWSDAEIAAEVGVSRESIRDRRRRLGLPSNALSPHRRQKVAERTAEQLRQAGLPSIGHLRVAAFRKFARQHGWPEDLRPRCVQILELLTVHSMLTRRQLAQALGVPWKGSRKSLVSNDPEGSYLAHLAAKGLVQRLPRVSLDPKSKYFDRVHLYALTPLAIALKEAAHGRNSERTDHSPNAAAGGAATSAGDRQNADRDGGSDGDRGQVRRQGQGGRRRRRPVRD